jgi:hypothetical protein
MDEISVVKNEVKYAGWIAMVEECQRSGLSIRAWCEANDINLKTYHYRLRRLRTMFLDQKKINTKPEIKKLQVIGQPVPIMNNITLHLEGITIEVPQGADESTIATVLRAVKSAW